MKQQILPKKMKPTRNSHRSTSRTKEKEKNQKVTPNSSIETKNKFKNIEQMKLKHIKSTIKNL